MNKRLEDLRKRKKVHCDKCEEKVMWYESNSRIRCLECGTTISILPDKKEEKTEVLKTRVANKPNPNVKPIWETPSTFGIETDIAWGLTERISYHKKKIEEHKKSIKWFKDTRKRVIEARK